MSKRVRCVGGPKHGRRFDVPETMSVFPARGGQYRVKTKAAVWEPDEPVEDREDGLSE